MEINKLFQNADYNQWLNELKQKFYSAQLKAAYAVNRELLQFYWGLGADIVRKQTGSEWGDGFLKQLSQDLMHAFPNMKGFSKRNLELIRQWYKFYTPSFIQDVNLTDAIAKQAVSQLILPQQSHPILTLLTQIPWGHNLAIIAKCKQLDEALFYVRGVNEHNWSRTVLIHQMETGLYKREGKAITNFSATLPESQSDLARQTLKDPYIFDFLTIDKEINERDLEQKLIEHITNFLLELGAGFAYIGKQYPLQVGEKAFFLDLLFYHTQLHCYVVIELKTGEFEPEHAGKLNFYLKTVDEQLRRAGDGNTIGILLCKTKDRLVAEYALSGIKTPMGIAEYQLVRTLPAAFGKNLPSIETLEVEFSRDVQVLE